MDAIQHVADVIERRAIYVGVVLLAVALLGAAVGWLLGWRSGR